ncbi:MAG: S-layer homology domain-containing protein, partial [Syntrophomonadaceae bacterium]
AIVDPDSKAEIAFALAAVRSETELTSTSLTAAVGTTPTFTIKVMGMDATDFVGFYTSTADAAKLAVTKDSQTGNFVFNAIAPGTAQVIVYRDYEGAAPDKDWLLKFNVTVTDSNDALLSALSVAGNQLKPAFDPNITDYRVVLASDPQGNFPVVSATKHDENANAVTTQATSSNPIAKVVVTAANGTTKKTYTVTFSVETPIPQDGGTINVGTVPVTIKPAVTPSGSQQVATLPALQVTGGAAEVTIPANVTVTGPAEWDGTITMPVVKETPSAAVNGSSVVVLEVGAGKDAGGNDIVLTFDKAVRLVMAGQQGKSAAYTRNGNLVSITRTINTDSQEVADRDIPAGEEAYIDVDNDKIIWTKHFTEFVSYTPAPSGGGGGGGSNTSGTTIKASTGGTVTSNGATIVVPAGAISSDIKVTVEKVTNVANLPMNTGDKLISDVLEITKDKSENFSKPVTISLTFDKSKVDNTKYDIAIYWLDTATNKWVKLDNVKVDSAAGKVSGDVNHFTKFAVIATEKATVTPETPDVLTDIAGNWAEANIKSLVASGAIAGYPDKTFRPDNTITRAEFASILVKAFKLEAKSGKVFEDTANHWAKDIISTANAYGIINGYSDTRFGPDDLISREQMAVMVVKAANLTAAGNSTAFTDDSQISAWAKDAVAIARSTGIISGYQDNTFRPQGKTTRAEAATVIVKAITK